MPRMTGPHYDRVAQNFRIGFRGPGGGGYEAITSTMAEVPKRTTPKQPSRAATILINWAVVKECNVIYRVLLRDL